jgi:uncharacterized protein (UPF0276 family)
VHDLPRLGVGLAYQAPLERLIRDVDCDDFDFVEVVPDILWTDLGPRAVPRYIDDEKNQLLIREVARHRPVVPHGIGLSIGSAHRFDTAHLAQLRRWRRWSRFPWHSDHLAFHLVRHEGREMNAGITMPLARDQATLDLLVPRIARVLREIDAPFLLENNVYYFDVPDAEMDEPTFLNRLTRESGCGLLLDLHNVHTNAVNHGFDAAAMIAELDLTQVGEIHVAGGMEVDGWYLDAHSDTVPDAVWALLEWTLARCPNLGGVVFELFGSWFETVGEARVRQDLRRLKAMWRGAGTQRTRPVGGLARSQAGGR